MLNKSNISSDNQKLIVYVFLTLAVLAVFWQVNHYDFLILDDNTYVTGNSSLKSGFTPEGLSWAFTTNHADFWHPVTWLSLMLDYKLFGLNAGGYHATNVLLHLLSVLLLFALFSRMTVEIWKSAFVAALFALHPLGVESVAWIALRKDLLSALFSILTLCLYVYYIEKPVMKRYLAALFCFALALMSKPMAVTLPLVMILLDYWPLKRFGSQKGNQVLWQIKEKTPFLVLSAVFSVITLYAHADSAMTHFSLTSRIANAPVSFIMYPGKIFWPYDMAVLQILSDKLPLWQVPVAVMLIIAVSVAVITVMKRFPYLFAGWLWYAITIGPVLGIIQINSQAITYHYAYLPSIGIYVMMAWGVPLFFPHVNTRRNILFPAAIVLVCLLAVLAWKQCGHWKNDIEVLKHALRVSKDNYTAHNMIATLTHNTVANYLVREGRIHEALNHYNEAIRISPSSAEVYTNRGNVYSSMGRYQRAIEDYNETIRLKPDYADAYNNRGNACAGMGLYYQAIEDYGKAIRLKPDLADAYSNRGNVYTRIGLSQNALQDFNESIRLNQTSTGAYNSRGILYVKLGRYQQAVNDFSKAIGLQKDCFEAFYNRGRAYSRMERYDQAIADYNKAIILKPGNAEVQKSLEYIYSKQGKDKSGCSPAQKACSSENPGYYE